MLVAMLTMASAVAAQGTKADYERAASLAGRARDKLTHLVEPGRWSTDGNRFWYRVDLGGGRRQFYFVDCAGGAKRLAFDHAKLAAALTKAGGQPVEAEKLPVDGLDQPAQGPMLLFALGRTWAWDDAAGTLTERPDAEPPVGILPDDEPKRASDSGTGACKVVFLNRTAGTLELFWLDFDGGRKSYGKIAAAGRMDMPTYVRHRWVLVDEKGQDVGSFGGRDGTWVALIDGKPRPRQRPTGPRDRQPRPAGGASPDGKWVAFIRESNVWLRPAGGGGEVQLSIDGKPGDAYAGELLWSPDSTRLVALRVVPAQEHTITMVESSPRDQVQPKLKTVNYLKPGDRVTVEKPHLFDVAARREIPVADTLFANPWDISDVRWQPDSSRFTFLFNQRGHQVLRQVAVDARSGVATALIDEVAKTFVCYSHKSFCQWLDDTSEAIWMSERDGWNHLYLYDTKTGAVKNAITHGAWVVRGVEQVDVEKRQILFTAGGIDPDQDPYQVHTCRVNFDGSGLTRLTTGDGTHRLDWSPDRRFYLDTWSRVDLPPVVELRRADDGKQICELDRADATALKATGIRPPERFVAKGRDGVTDIWGIIIRPTNWDPNAKYPVLEDIYAGPHAAFVPKSWSSYHGMMELAELGFIVVKIDGMGTSYRSKAFHDVCWQNLADAGFPDRIAWMKAAAAKDPSLDLTRVGLYGGSAGGQNALGGLLTHPEFYKAGFADCGCHDNRMDKIWWNEQWMGWPIGPQYAANSNVTLAPKLQGKLLLTVGELDDNVDPASTMQVVNALIKADKDFELIVFPGANHGAGGSPYGRRRMMDFFVRSLMGVEPRR